MKTNRTIRPRAGLRGAALLLFAALGTGLSGCKKPAPAAPPPPVVQVMTVSGTNAPISTEIIGQLDSPQNVQVRARVEAFVEKILFTEGTNVMKDDLLFQLDRRPFEEARDAAEGALAEAEAALKKYQTDVARLEPLWEKRAIPKQDLDNARASVDVGVASVRSAQANLKAALLDLDYCQVRAPVSGLIGAKEVSVGELVGKGEPTLLATISTLNPIWFYCAVGEVDYLKAEAEAKRTGKRVADLPATLLLADGSVHPSQGRFVFIDRAVDVKTGTLRVRAEFPNPDEILRPGMFARIKVDLGTRADSILVPERAVAELQGKNFVWVVGEDNKTAQRAVLVGESLGGNLLIREGLKAGERIVMEGLQKVREGSVVQPQTAAELAAAAPEPAHK